MAHKRYPLGRLPSKADSRNYKMVTRPLSAIKEKSKIWKHGPVLDQGENPWCVAFSAQAALLAWPIKNVEYLDPHKLYLACQAADGIPGRHEGSTVHAAADVLHHADPPRFGEYRFGNDVMNQIAPWLLVDGPVLLGITWFNQMFDPDPDGWLNVSGSVAGGHAILAIGIDLLVPCPDGSTGAVLLLNSWGRTWGGWKGEKGRKIMGGCAWISLAGLKKCLKADGEACAYVELKVKAGTG